MHIKEENETRVHLEESYYKKNKFYPKMLNMKNTLGWNQNIIHGGSINIGLSYEPTKYEIHSSEGMLELAKCKEQPTKKKIYDQ